MLQCPIARDKAGFVFTVRYQMFFLHVINHQFKIIGSAQKIPDYLRTCKSGSAVTFKQLKAETFSLFINSPYKSERAIGTLQAQTLQIRKRNL